VATAGGGELHSMYGGFGMKILVTGGAGFIGSHVVDRYLSLGHEVAIVDNLSTGVAENLNPAATFYEVDITDAEALEQVLTREKPEVVNHHAAQMDIQRGVREPTFDAIVNIVGSINLVEVGLRHGLRKMIYASSGGACYGNPEVVPATEQTPVRPVSQYGASKHTVEHYLYLYNHNDGLQYTVLRYANVYGPRQNPHGEAGVTAIFAMLMLRGDEAKIFGKGDKTRDYVFVDDVVEANVLALTGGENDIFNIITGTETTDRQVFDAMAAAAGYDRPPFMAPERKGEIRRTALSPEKARRLLGWEPKTPFEEGCRRVVEYRKGRQ